MRIFTTYTKLPETKFYATVGMFDGVHRGHRYILQQLKQLAEENSCSPLVITFTSHPQKLVNPFKKTGMLTTTSQKLRLIEECGVPYCLLLEFSNDMLEMSTGAFLSILKTKMGVEGIVAGFNNRFGNEKSITSEQQRLIASGLGIAYHVADEFSETGDNIHISSSQIRLLLKEQKVAEANRLLGHRFEIGGTVRNGLRIGRSIGFPTANLVPDDADILIPADGAYACMAVIPCMARSIYPAMVNIGCRPTIGECLERTIEANVIGLEEGDNSLYGKSMRLIFLDFIRPEVKFSSLEELRRQLETDRAIATEKYSELIR